MMGHNTYRSSQLCCPKEGHVIFSYLLVFKTASHVYFFILSLIHLGSFMIGEEFVSVPQWYDGTSDGIVTILHTDACASLLDNVLEQK